MNKKLVLALLIGSTCGQQVLSMGGLSGGKKVWSSEDDIDDIKLAVNKASKARDAWVKSITSKINDLIQLGSDSFNDSTTKLNSLNTALRNALDALKEADQKSTKREEQIVAINAAATALFAAIKNIATHEKNQAKVLIDGVFTELATGTLIAAQATRDNIQSQLNDFETRLTLALKAFGTTPVKRTLGEKKDDAAAADAKKSSGFTSILKSTASDLGKGVLKETAGALGEVATDFILGLFGKKTKAEMLAEVEALKKAKIKLISMLDTLQDEQTTIKTLFNDAANELVGKLRLATKIDEDKINELKEALKPFVLKTADSKITPEQQEVALNAAASLAEHINDKYKAAALGFYSFSAKIIGEEETDQLASLASAKAKLESITKNTKTLLAEIPSVTEETKSKLLELEKPVAKPGLPAYEKPAASTATQTPNASEYPVFGGSASASTKKAYNYFGQEVANPVKGQQYWDSADSATRKLITW